jgi:hypothetical protein
MQSGPSIQYRRKKSILLYLDNLCFAARPCFKLSGVGTFIVLEEIIINDRGVFIPLYGPSFLTSPSLPRRHPLPFSFLAMEYSGSLCVPQLSLQETASIPKILIEDKELSDHDIYCEVQYPPSLASRPESTYSHSPSLTASSISFRLAGGRLGAIATRLERAITRWARTNWADSSASLNSDISSDSSRSSFRTANKSTRRKHRHPSAADIQSFERTVAERLRAREARRAVRVPREFNLYSPFEDNPSQGPGPVEESQQVVRTFSLDLILPHLEISLRRRGKSRRARPRGGATATEPDYPHRGRTLWRDGAGNASRVDELDDASHRLEKGKDKMASATPPPMNAPKRPSIPLPVRDPEAGKLPPAWWLDVANPSWEDMRTLGKVSSSFYLNKKSSQLRSTVIASSPFDTGGYSTAGAA